LLTHEKRKRDKSLSISGGIKDFNQVFRRKRKRDQLDSKMRKRDSMSLLMEGEKGEVLIR